MKKSVIGRKLIKERFHYSTHFLFFVQMKTLTLDFNTNKKTTNNHENFPH